MDKNQFLIYNDIVNHLYDCKTVEELKNNFLKPVKMLIPYSYSSILLARKDLDSSDSLAEAKHLYQEEPICVPDTFTQAERRYIEKADEDPILWMMHGNESTLIRESDILEEKDRLGSSLYRYCYQKYDIYDTMQYSIVYNRKLFGILTLFRTRIDGLFQNDDMFFLRSVGVHLNKVFFNILSEKNNETFCPDIGKIKEDYGLTGREAEILECIFKFKGNDEIAKKFDISILTVQKHIQNLLRKLDADSKWGILNKFLQCQNDTP